jgi:hypothetical protein
MQQHANIVVESVEAREEDTALKTAQPVELTQEQLLQVMGGLGPNGNWSTTSVAGPNGNW